MQIELIENDDGAETKATTRYASRKWLMAAFVVLVAAGMRVADLLDQSGLLTAWGSAMALYFAANVVQKATTKEGV